MEQQFFEVTGGSTIGGDCHVIEPFVAANSLILTCKHPKSRSSVYVNFTSFQRSRCRILCFYICFDHVFPEHRLQQLVHFRISYTAFSISPCAGITASALDKYYVSMLPNRSNTQLDEQLQQSSPFNSQKNESIRQPTAKIQPQGQVLCLSRNEVVKWENR